MVDEMRPAKKRLTNRELRYGFDRSNANNSSFTRVFLNRMHEALRRNLKEYMMVRGIVDPQKNTDSFYKQFVESQVRLDVHFLEPVKRAATNGLFEVVPRMIKEGQRTVTDGMSTNPSNRRGLNSNNNTTAIVAYVWPYDPTGGVHGAHAIGAFKLNNVLYAFNSWGEAYITTDRRTSRVLPDNAVWDYLRRKYRCSTVMVYTGKNFQAENSDGVCVGFANDFGTYMYTYLMLSTGFPGHFPEIPGPETVYERIGNMVYSKEYNAFVEHVVSAYRGGFKTSLGAACPVSLKSMFNRLRWSTVPVNNNKVNTFDVMSRAIVKNVELRKALLEIARNNDRTRVADARTRVRAILRKTDTRLGEMNSNALNADVRRYIQSGNLNMSLIRSTNVRMN